MVKWNANTEEDFAYYVLQYDTNSNFSTAKEIRLNATSTVLKELNVNTTYYIRIKAVDLSGNESDWSATVSASTVNLNDATYYDYAAIKDAIIQNGYIDSAWISELDAGKITTGYLDADVIGAKSLTLDKLSITPALPLPPGALAYWNNSLIDEISGITPNGYDEINLSPSITLVPENAPPGSVVGDLLAGNMIYASRRIEVGEGENRWAIDGSTGFTRVINNQDNPLLAMIYSGVVNITDEDNGTKLVTLPQKLTKYTVLLLPQSFCYWKNMAATSEWHLQLFYEDLSNDTQTQFKIVAQVMSPPTTSESSLNITLTEK